MACCIFCGTAERVNTRLVITVDDGHKVSVDICDEHAEEATVKTARAAYLRRQEQIQEVLQKARMLGLNVSDPSATPGGLTVAESQIVAESRPEPVVGQRPDDDAEMVGDDVVPAELVDARNRKAIISVSGTTEFGSIQSHTSYDTSSLQSRLPDEVRRGKVKMMVVEGRDGQPLLIPAKRVDGTGTTYIVITKQEDDARLQSRFKKMAKDSIERGRMPDFAKAGYQNTQAICQLCQGACVISRGNREVSCPECGGSGIISTY